MAAAKIILDRVAPARRFSPFELPMVKCRADSAPAHAAILDAVADGALTAGEAEGVSNLVKESWATAPAAIAM
jgi:hypothetical protein